MEKLNKKIILFITGIVIIVSVLVLAYGRYWKERKIPIESSEGRNIRLEKKFEPKPVKFKTTEAEEIEESDDWKTQAGD